MGSLSGSGFLNRGLAVGATVTGYADAANSASPSRTNRVAPTPR
jgi:hypothetical protein